MVGKRAVDLRVVDAVIFAGPTLSFADVEMLWSSQGHGLKCQVLPPVSQGDVASLARRRPRSIGIIDGYFDRVPAVWHKEILWAMSKGVHVFGAASMGALRAAELAAFGMQGVGQVYADFHRGELTDDDEVAVAHGSGDEGYRTHSVALVDIRATLRTAQAEGIIDAAAHQCLVDRAKALFYPRRDYQRVLQEAQAHGLSTAEAEALETWLVTGRVEQKRADAVAMVQAMVGSLKEHGEPKEVAYFFNSTSTWRDLERSLAEQRPLDRRLGAETLPEGALIDELRLMGEPYLQLRAQAMSRVLSLEVADLHRLETTQSDRSLADLQQRLQKHLQLGPDLSSEDIEGAWQQWLKEQGASQGEMRRIAGDEARVQKVQAFAADHVETQLLDLLRFRGQLGALRQRARRKEEILAGRGHSRVELRDLGPDDDELWRWYFEGFLAREQPVDLETYAREHDFTDLAELRWTVLREYLSQTLGDDEISPLSVTPK